MCIFFYVANCDFYRKVHDNVYREIFMVLRAVLESALPSSMGPNAVTPMWSMAYVSGLGKDCNSETSLNTHVSFIHSLTNWMWWYVFDLVTFGENLVCVLSEAYSQISNRGRSQKFLDLNFLHLFIALQEFPLKNTFPIGIKQKPFQCT